MDRNLIRECIIDELNIKLGDGVDSAYAAEVPVMVHFDFEPAEEDDPAQVYVRAAKIGKEEGVALRGERTTMTFEQGCDILAYLDTDQVDKIAENLLARHDLALAEQD